MLFNVSELFSQNVKGKMAVFPGRENEFVKLGVFQNPPDLTQRS